MEGSTVVKAIRTFKKGVFYGLWYTQSWGIARNQENLEWKKREEEEDRLTKQRRQ